jgi:hypothetical protein
MVPNNMLGSQPFCDVLVSSFQAKLNRKNLINHMKTIQQTMINTLRGHELSHRSAKHIQSKILKIRLEIIVVFAIVGWFLSPQASAQSANATTMFNGYNNAFLVTSGSSAYYKTALNNTANDGTWTESLDIQGAEDAYEVSGSAAQQTLVNNLCATWLVNNPPPWSWDGWNDDIGWFTITLARGYQMTGTANFLTQAEYGFNYAFGRGWDTQYNGGGIWEQNPSYAGGTTLEKCALSNDSLGKTACMLYQSTGNITYLNEAEQIYAWVWHNLYNPSTGEVYAGIYTNGVVDTGTAVYNQGTFIDFANLLYECGAGGTYLNDAKMAIQFTENNLTSGGILSNNAGYLNTWADEFARGIGHVCGYTPSLWSTYYPFMSNNANSAWNNRRTDYNITWNAWNQATPVVNNTIPTTCVSAVAMLEFTPASQPPASPAGTHAVINKYSRLALDDPGFSTGNGTNIDQWGYNGGSNQKWTFTQNSDGSYTIINQNSGKALEDPGFGTANGTKVDQWTSNSGTNQHWTVTPNQDGTYTIINKTSGLALEDPGFSTANGTQMDQWANNNGPNQCWILQ